MPINSSFVYVVSLRRDLINESKLYTTLFKRSWRCARDILRRVCTLWNAKKQTWGKREAAPHDELTRPAHSSRSFRRLFATLLFRQYRHSLPCARGRGYHDDIAIWIPLLLCAPGAFARNQTGTRFVRSAESRTTFVASDSCGSESSTRWHWIWSMKTWKRTLGEDKRTRNHKTMQFYSIYRDNSVFVASNQTYHVNSHCAEAICSL